MIISKIITPTNNWNNNVLKFNGEYTQTTQHANYINKVLGNKPIFVVFEDKDSNKIVGQLLFFKKKKFGLINRNYFNGNPIIINNNITAKETIYELLNKVLKRKLQKLIYETTIIDLTIGRDKILKNADKNSVRKNIKRSKERGVIIKNVTSQKKGLIDYVKILYENRKKLNIEKRNKTEVLHDVLTMVKDNLHNQVFVAYWNNIPIGGTGCTIFNKKITGRGITRNEIDQSEHLYCNDALRLELIIHGINNNCKEYDLAGIVINGTDKEKNIAINKLKWNGIKREVIRFV